MFSDSVNLGSNPSPPAIFISKLADAKDDGLLVFTSPSFFVVCDKFVQNFPDFKTTVWCVFSD
jgi:hypothetical protein